MIIDFVLLKFVPETKIFTLDAGTVEVLDMAVKHRDEIDAPVESTSTKPASHKRPRPPKKPDQQAKNKRKSAPVATKCGEDGDREEAEDDDKERRTKKKERRTATPSKHRHHSSSSAGKSSRARETPPGPLKRATVTSMAHACPRLEGQRPDHQILSLRVSSPRHADIRHIRVRIR